MTPVSPCTSAPHVQTEPTQTPASGADLALSIAIHNAKCKPTAAFLYNISAAILITGVITNVIKPKPDLDPILFLLTATFATIFYGVAASSLNQMKA